MLRRKHGRYEARRLGGKSGIRVGLRICLLITAPIKDSEEKCFWFHMTQCSDLLLQDGSALLETDPPCTHTCKNKFVIVFTRLGR